MFKPIRYQLLQNIALKLCGEIKPFCLEILDIPFKYLDIGNGEYEATLKCLHIWKDKSPVHTTAMLLDNIEKARSENQLDTHVEELFDGLSSDKLAVSPSSSLLSSVARSVTNGKTFCTVYLELNLSDYEHSMPLVESGHNFNEKVLSLWRQRNSPKNTVDDLMYLLKQGLKYNLILSDSMKEIEETVEEFQKSVPNMNSRMMELCDFLIKTANGHIKCNSLDLQHAGVYLMELLDDKKIQYVDATQVGTDAWASLCQRDYFFHCNSIVRIIELSKQCNLPKLRKECFMFMERSCDVNTVCYYYEVAKFYDNTALLKHVSYEVRKNFSKLVENQAIQDMSLASLCQILKADEFNVENENIIFDAVEQLQKLENASTDCYSSVRYEHMSISYLEKVKKNVALQNLPQVQDAIKRDATNHSYIEQARYWFSKIVYVDKKDGFSEYFGSSTGWSDVRSLIDWMDKGSSIGTYTGRDRSYDLIVAGAENSGTGGQLISFIDLSDAGREVKQVDLRRVHLDGSVIAIDNYIYVVGGYVVLKGITLPSNHMYRLNINKGKWRPLDPPVNAESLLGAMVIYDHNFIYVLGGQVPMKSSVQVFDRFNETSGWKKRKDMPSGCNQDDSGVIVYRGKVTVITPDQCMQYSREEDSWHTEKYTCGSLGKSVQPLIYEGCIVACVEHNVDYTILQYDIDENEWTPKMEGPKKAWSSKYNFYSM